MRGWRFTAGLAMAALLAGCGGGGDGGSGGPTAGTGGTGAAPVPNPTPTPVASTGECTLHARQDWAAQQLREWYLFPETLPAALDPSGFGNLSDYVDALTATARGQRRDRYFTYVTSIREETAYYESGETAGFGLRLALDTSNRLVVTEAFEGGPGLAAGIDRGAVIEAIGTGAGNLRTVSAILSSGGGEGLTNALGPDTPGTSRMFRLVAGSRVVTVTKTSFDLTPVSSRYGVRILQTAGGPVGYLNLRTFIDTAEPALRQAFAQFRSAGVTNLVVDLRYNGGGLVSVAELMGDLLGGGRSTSDVFSYRTYRSEKSQFNETNYFSPQPQSVAPVRIAFIGTDGTASASELVTNAFVPYLRGNAALIGSNTYGKPVGQIARDREECDDRLRVVAFASQNAARQGNYFNGLADTVEASCRADDDLGRPLGDPQEASLAAAIAFLQGRSCQRIGLTGSATMSARTGPNWQMLPPSQGAGTAQREVPGLF